MGSSFLGYIKDLVYNKNKNFLCVVCGSTGCQPKGDKVLMADGSWKNIENIQVGDEVISPQEDGTNLFAKVTKTTSWFCDNIFAIKEANKNKQIKYYASYNHKIPILKLVHPRKNGRRSKASKFWKYALYSAEEYSKLATEGKSHRTIGFSSFMIKNFKNRKNCEIEPYTLGFFLGDGFFNNGSLRITTSYKEPIKYISKYYKYLSVLSKNGTVAKDYAFSINSDLGKLLKKVNLNNKKSGDKFIPKEALLSDSNYRKKLLAGLLDSDGYYNNGSYEYTSKSKKLIEDITFLVYSLGGRCGKIRKIKKKIKSLNFEGTYYSISIYLHNLKLPFLLNKSKKKCNSIYLSSNRVAIDSIKTDKKEQVFGFEIDSPSKWYITNDFMVTHNSGKSYSSLRLAEALDPNFDVSRIAFTPADFMNIINRKDIKTGDIIIFDECGVGMSSRSWYSSTNKMINYILQTFRHQNLIVFFTVPDFSFVDSQARKLFHCYIETVSIKKRERKVVVKPLLLQNNPKLGKVYYKYPIIEGSKITRLEISMPSLNLRRAYEKKKQEFTRDLRAGVESHIKAEGGGIPTKKLTPTEQLVYDFRRKGLTQKQVAEEINKLKGTHYTNTAICIYEKKIRLKGYDIKDMRNKTKDNSPKKDK